MAKPKPEKVAINPYWSLAQALTFLEWGEPFTIKELMAADGLTYGERGMRAKIRQARKGKRFSTHEIMAEMEQAWRELLVPIAEGRIEVIGRKDRPPRSELEQINPHWFLERPAPKALYLFDEICADEASKETGIRMWKDVQLNSAAVMRLRRATKPLQTPVTISRAGPKSAQSEMLRALKEAK